MARSRGYLLRYQREYRLRNREKIKERRRQYCRRYRKKIKEYQRKYFQRNKARIRVYRRLWYRKKFGAFPRPGSPSSAGRGRVHPAPACRGWVHHGKRGLGIHPKHFTTNVLTK